MGDRILRLCFNCNSNNNSDNSTTCGVGDDDDDKHLSSNLERRLPKCAPSTTSVSSSFSYVVCGTSEIIKKILK
jgi:hypothetical protein